MTVAIPRMRGAASDGAVVITRMLGTASGTGRVAIARMHGESLGAFVVDAGLGQTVDPFQVVQLNAVVVTTGVSATDWAWTQTAGPAVTLVDTGPTRRFRAPALRYGTPMSFQAAGIYPGFPDAVDTTTIVVRSHSGFYRVDGSGQLYAMEYRKTARTPLPPASIIDGGGPPAVPSSVIDGGAPGSVATDFLDGGAP